MKTLYLDLSMGAAGDMLTAALLELVPDRQKIIDKLNNLGIPGVEFVLENAQKCGITGSHMSVLIYGEEESDHHSHNGLHDIEHIVSHFTGVPSFIKKQILQVYNHIAQAESQVHGEPVNEIHFHEVGTLDAIADVTAVCMLMNEVNADIILASPIHVGSGTVKCAHGILPVPAPATAVLLEGMPFYSEDIKGELCTPTGAALLKFFVDQFVEKAPLLKNTIVGHGMGKKDFTRPNCVTAILGEQ